METGGNNSQQPQCGTDTGLPCTAKPAGGAVVEGAHHENQHPQRRGEAQVYNGVVK